MRNEELSAWLFEHGGPVIRYRTAAELLPPSKSINIQQLRDEMMQSPQVQKWLGNLIPPRLLLNNPTTTPHVLESGLMEIHGSKPTNLENVIGKLTDFGLKKGIPEFDQRTIPYRKWLEENAERPTENVFDKFSVGMIASFLARAGYVQEPAVGIVLKNRLNTVYDFTRKGDFDIYVKPEKYIRHHRLIKLEVVRGEICRLPLIYDIIGWAAYLPECGTEEDLAKADNIIDYILNEEYQKLPWGYGIMGDGAGRTWGLGWSVHLPGFIGSPATKDVNKSVVQMVNLLVNFRIARQHSWFIESLNHLEEFRTEKGTYMFPGDYLQEKPVGYWVNGVHMGLEENRRRNLELESTFWMAKLRKILSDYNQRT